MRDGHGGVDCDTCNLSQCDYELKDGRCCRCGADPDTGRPRRMDEEIGYRRGFQQGYVAALERFGIENGDDVGRQIYNWRHDWRSIARCADQPSNSEWPVFAWIAAGRFPNMRRSRRATYRRREERWIRETKMHDITGHGLAVNTHPVRYITGGAAELFGTDRATLAAHLSTAVDTASDFEDPDDLYAFTYKDRRVWVKRDGESDTFTILLPGEY